MICLGGCQKGPYHTSNMHMVKKVIVVTNFKYEVILDLQGCLEAIRVLRSNVLMSM